MESTLEPLEANTELKMKILFNLFKVGKGLLKSKKATILFQ